MINSLIDEIISEWTRFIRETTNKGIIRKIERNTSGRNNLIGRRRCSVGPPQFTIENRRIIKKLVNKKLKEGGKKTKSEDLNEKRGVIKFEKTKSEDLNEKQDEIKIEKTKSEDLEKKQDEIKIEKTKSEDLQKSDNKKLKKDSKKREKTKSHDLENIVNKVEINNLDLEKIISEQDRIDELMGKKKIEVKKTNLRKNKKDLQINNYLQDTGELDEYTEDNRIIKDNINQADDLKDLQEDNKIKKVSKDNIKEVGDKKDNINEVKDKKDNSKEVEDKKDNINEVKNIKVIKGTNIQKHTNKRSKIKGTAVIQPEIKNEGHTNKKMNPPLLRRNLKKQVDSSETRLSILNGRRGTRRFLFSDDEDDLPFNSTELKSVTKEQDKEINNENEIQVDSSINPFSVNKHEIIKDGQILEVFQNLINDNKDDLKQETLKNDVPKSVISSENKSKPKKPSKTKKKPLVLKRTVKRKIKTNISMNDINEKLEFIKSGRKSSIKEHPKVELENNSSLTIKLVPVEKEEAAKINEPVEKVEKVQNMEVKNVDDVNIENNENYKDATTDNNEIVKDVNIEYNEITKVEHFNLSVKSRIVNKEEDNKQISSNVTDIPSTFETVEVVEIVTKNKKAKDMEDIGNKKKDLKMKNELLKNLFKLEKIKIEAKRNSVFLGEKNEPEVEKLISKMQKNKATNKNVIVPPKGLSSIPKNIVPVNSEFMINLKIRPVKNEYKSKLAESTLEPEINLKEPEIKPPKDLEIKPEIKLVNQKDSEIRLLEKSKIYDVKSSKYIRDPSDLYKKVIDSQRKFISQNEYKSSTVIPHIKSDEEDSLIFIEPVYCKDPDINLKVCQQDHDMLESYFNLCEDINVVEIFPSIKDISNDSPNRWR